MFLDFGSPTQHCLRWELQIQTYVHNSNHWLIMQINSSSAISRLQRVDSIHALGAFLVVLSHVQYSGNGSSLTQICYYPLTRVAVPLFFMPSGIRYCQRTSLISIFSKSVCWKSLFHSLFGQWSILHGKEKRWVNQFCLSNYCSIKPGKFWHLFGTCDYHGRDLFKNTPFILSTIGSVIYTIPLWE